MRFATKALHVGQEPEKAFHSVVNPIYQTTTYAWESLDSPPEFEYTRYAGPNAHALESVLASLENAKHAMVFSSGMAAIHAGFSILRPGNHLLVASDIYGGTHRLAYTELTRNGIEVSDFDARDPTTIGANTRPNTKMVIFETPTNPTLRVMDIAANVEQAHAQGHIVVFDNTFASPALQNPLDLGVDIVVHSTTKYLAGHSDATGGAVLTNDTAHFERMRAFGRIAGASPAPFEAWLTLRGVKTLSCRMKAHCENAGQVAAYLDGHSRVTAVHYPGLPTHPEHALAARQMRGFGGMLAFTVDGTPEQAKRVAANLNLFTLAASLGGVESLIGYPPKMSHTNMTEEMRIEKGIPANLLRVSVGLEDAADLLEDLDQALKSF